MPTLSRLAVLVLNIIRATLAIVFLGSIGLPSKVDAHSEVATRTYSSGRIQLASWWKPFVISQNDDLKTGPDVGQRVPDFKLPDQYGKLRSLNDLMGPKGLLLVFYRSANW